MKQHKCFLCNKILHEDKISDWDFEFSCILHKGLAQLSTELFFENNKDFTKW